MNWEPEKRGIGDKGTRNAKGTARRAKREKLRAAGGEQSGMSNIESQMPQTQ